MVTPTTMPTLFINHGAGPMPLMGVQPHLVQHIKDVVKKVVPEKPKAIVVLSAHWEEGNTSSSASIQVTSNDTPRSLYYDYGGFPPEMYKLDYPAPGHPALSKQIQTLLQESCSGIEKVELDYKRGFDHGVFVPLLVMYPDADIPVIAVSMHASLDPEANMKIGQALVPLREKGVLIMGSGMTFHNFNTGIRPTQQSVKSALNFNDWLKETLVTGRFSEKEVRERLNQWEKASGGRASHPREDHLLPLFMAAAAGSFSGGQVIYDTAVTKSSDPFSDHPIVGFAFL